jgi:hypothetical protein
VLPRLRLVFELLSPSGSGDEVERLIFRFLSEDWGATDSIEAVSVMLGAGAAGRCDCIGGSEATGEVGAWLLAGSASSLDGLRYETETQRLNGGFPDSETQHAQISR